MKLKLLLVDDHFLFREGLQYLLETHGIEVAGVANNGLEALKQARLSRPDVILMDIKMPECSGLDALKLIKAEMPEIKVVMLTTSEEDEDLIEAVKYGAAGYLIKNTNAKELVEMLSDLEKGEVPVSTGLATRLWRELPPSGTAVAEAQLTERQLEVLAMVARGITYKEAGDALSLTERTVKYHMSRIIEQLQLENRAQVIAYAARMGLVKEGN